MIGKIIRFCVKEIIGGMINIRKEENIEELWKLYLKTRDADYREKLINHYLFLVKIALGRFIYNLPSFIERDDLEGYGIIGLMQAFERFQPEKGLKFETYALSRIRGAALDYLRSLDPMTRGQRRKFKEVMGTWHQLQSEKGKEPTLEEISNEMSISVQDISWIIEQNRTGIFFSLDQEKGEGGRELGDDIADERADVNPQDILENRELLEFLGKKIDELPDREKFCISLYYYEGLTLKEIGRVLGVGEPRVSQILSQTILKLRSKMNSWGEHRRDS